MDVNNKGWTLSMNGVLAPCDQFCVAAKVLSGHASINIGQVEIDLGTLGGANSWMNWGGLNDRGRAVGMAETSVPDPDGEDFCAFGTKKTYRPFLWQNGTMSALPTLGGNNGSASDINNRAEIAGAAEAAVLETGCPANAFMHVISPVIWEEGKAKALPTVHGDPDGVAFAINDRGQAVGDSGTCGGGIHAISWENGMASSLPDLGTFANARALTTKAKLLAQPVAPTAEPDMACFGRTAQSQVSAFCREILAALRPASTTGGKWWGATGTPASTGPMPSSGRTA